jgi:hypothetical protein
VLRLQRGHGVGMLAARLRQRRLLRSDQRRVLRPKLLQLGCQRRLAGLWCTL